MHAVNLVVMSTPNIMNFPSISELYYGICKMQPHYIKNILWSSRLVNNEFEIFVLQDFS